VIKKLIIGVAIAIFLFGAGAILPRFLISDGIANFSGEKQEVAKFSYLVTSQLIGGSAEPLWVTKLKVINIKEVSGGPVDIDVYGKSVTLSKNYEAIVQKHRWFGIPGDTCAVSTDGWVSC